MKKIIALFMCFIIFFSTGVTAFAEGNIKQKLTVPAGTVIPLKTENVINQNSYVQGDSIIFLTTGDVVVGGKLVFKAGSVARGTVKALKRHAAFGIPTSISIEVTSITTEDGQTIPLTGNRTFKGDSNKSWAVVGFLFFLPLMFIHGKNVEIPAGTDMEAIVNQPVTIMVP